ncbi:MAG TPA: luciferase family protein [Candidatus Limnocylindria bacterium]|nr:luciferase family protein [Candidatus Limnocylindria bacterium]
MLAQFMKRGARMRGVTVRPSRFKGPRHTDALWYGTREVAHCHDGQVDVRLTRQVVRELRDELRSDARIDLRGPGFDWILVRVRRAADVERALELLRHAVRVAVR